jgi:hypothetical protein
MDITFAKKSVEYINIIIYFVHCYKHYLNNNLLTKNFFIFFFITTMLINTEKEKFFKLS